MAAFAIKDAHALMNALYRQATGETISVQDHAGFVDAGTKTLATGTENVLNSIARTIKDVVIQSRPYTGKFKLISATEDAFNTRIAKISVYNSYNDESGAFNTDLNTNIANGNNDDSGAGSQWEQKLPKVVERFFLSEVAWDKFYTTPLIQLQSAFNDEAQFVAFWNAIMTEIQNDIEETIEARNRAIVADRIAGTKLMVDAKKIGPESFVNLTELVNKEYGTTWTTDEILTAHKEEFLKVYVAKIKIDSDRLEERTKFYHDAMEITDGGVKYQILRHTPKANQKLMYFGELFTKAKVNVMPEIFNPSYLDTANGEAVTYWQSSNDADRMKVACKPALPDGTASSNVTIDKVVGILFDTEAMATINQFTGAYTTPVNARKVYTNTFYHYKFGSVQDYTENAIVYYMADPQK